MLESLVASPSSEEWSLLQVPGPLSWLKITVRERDESLGQDRKVDVSAQSYMHLYFLLHTLFCLSMHTKVHLGSLGGKRNSAGVVRSEIFYVRNTYHGLVSSCVIYSGS